MIMCLISLGNLETMYFKGEAKRELDFMLEFMLDVIC